MKRVPSKDDVTAAMQGDKAAIARVFDAMWPIITQHARRFGRNIKHDVDDFTQQGVLAIYDALRTFNPAKKRAFHWHATQWLRSRMGYVLKREANRHEVSTELPIGDSEHVLGDTFASQAPHTDELVIRSECVRNLRFAIDAIEMPAHREIMIQRAAGHDYATIGRSVGYSREYVRQVVRLHMQSLSETLEREAA